MAFLPDRRVTRRAFLAVSAGAIAGGRLVAEPQGEGAEPARTRWALLSDTHISENLEDSYRGSKPHANLSKAFEEIAAREPDGAIIAGDLARLEGLPGDYAALKALVDGLAATTPVGLALGNHDDRNNFLAAFTVFPGERQAIPGKVVQVIRRGPARFILLDSLFYVNHAEGFLTKRQRAWLGACLEAADDTPTFLCVHHTLDDEDSSLLDSDRLLNLVRPVRKVKAIFYGHSHAYRYDQVDGLHLINLPATGYNFDDAQPIGWVDGVFTAEGGEFTLRAIAGATGQDGTTTQVMWRA